MPAASPTRWSVVVPVKRLAVAKTRLALPDPARERIALAMALDTVAAALGCDRVAAVLVVSDDPKARSALAPLGVRVVADEPDAGLDAALLHGAQVSTAGAPGLGVAALSSDLPALVPRDLAAALDAAATHSVALVADASGTGTTLLTAAPGRMLPVSYGAGSRDRHVAAGAVDLTLALPSLRRDVDTVADLREAAALGLGTRTAAVATDLGLFTTPAAPSPPG